MAFSVETLRGYAGHMRTPVFATAVDQVLALAAARGTAVMCAESLWWRCHRRMLADFVSAARGMPVRHLMHDGRLEEHRLSPGLRLRDDGLLVYDGGQATAALAEAWPGLPQAEARWAPNPLVCQTSRRG